MSHSPWGVDGVYRQIAEEIAQTPALREGGVLILDESAEERRETRVSGRNDNTMGD
jgi:hypothetical protein